MKYKKDWEAAQEEFINWWKHKNTRYPLMIVMAKKENPVPLDSKYAYDTKDGWEDVPPLKFDPENEWFKKHLEVVKKCTELAGGDFYTTVSLVRAFYRQCFPSLH